MTKKDQSKPSSTTTSVVARQDNGNIQITYTLPKDLISKTRSEVLAEFAKDMEIPGFRKGNAPISKVEAAVDPQKLTEHVLQHILPAAFSESIKTHKLNPAIFPKFSIVKSEPDNDWQIEAVTCEIPQITLGDYKKKIAGELAAKKIVVPGKKEEEKVTDEKLLTILLESVKVEIPSILVEEEVNARLSSLLDRIEKLGLQLEKYLQTVGKTPQSLRQEYKKQSEDSIKVELILNKIAEEEQIQTTQSEIEEFIKSTGSDPQKVDPGQKDILTRVLKRRKALEKLASL